jgi:hypothetical protein
MCLLLQNEQLSFSIPIVFFRNDNVGACWFLIWLQRLVDTFSRCLSCYILFLSFLVFSVIFCFPFIWVSSSTFILHNSSFFGCGLYTAISFPTSFVIFDPQFVYKFSVLNDWPIFKV